MSKEIEKSELEETRELLENGNHLIKIGGPIFALGLATLCATAVTVSEVPDEVTIIAGSASVGLTVGGAMILSEGERMKDNAISLASRMGQITHNNLFRGKISS